MIFFWLIVATALVIVPKWKSDPVVELIFDPHNFTAGNLCMHKNLMYIHSMEQNHALIKGSLNTILLKLLHENGRMYGYEMTRMVKELSAGNMQLTEGALYPALHKMEADGLVETKIEEVGNRKRKYYSITDSGKKESGRKVKELAAFISQMENVLKLKLATR